MITEPIRSGVITRRGTAEAIWIALVAAIDRDGGELTISRADYQDALRALGIIDPDTEITWFQSLESLTLHVARP